MEILRAKTIQIESLFNFMDFPGSWLRSVESALYQPVGIVYGEPGNNALFSSVIQAVQKKRKHMAAAEVKGG